MNNNLKVNTSPLVSIIIPAYNIEKYLSETIDSVISQTVQNWECIIINDGSTDNTQQIINEYCKKDSRIRSIYQNNQGVSIARNTGIDNSFGEYIAFLDSDDIWMPNHLEHLLDVIQKYKVDFAYSLAYTIVNDKYTTNLVKYHDIKTGFLKGKEIIEHLLTHNDIDTPMVVCKKQILLNCNKFVYDKNGEDIYAWLTLLLNNHSFYSSSEVTGYVRIRTNSTSSVDRMCTRESVEITHLLKDRLEDFGINYNYYFKLWARRYFLLKNNKTHYKDAIFYINSIDNNYFSIFKYFVNILPKKMIKLITLIILKK